MQEKENVIEILEKAEIALEENDSITIKHLSNRTMHASSIYQDPDNINIAVILYALSKIMERTHYQELGGWGKFEKTFARSLENALIVLKRKDIEVYRDQIDQIKNAIKDLSGHLKTYVEQVFRKAQINKASRIYEHGISLAKTAKILGVSLWELNSYVGQTGISEVNLTYTLDIKQRLKNAEEMFE